VGELNGGEDGSGRRMTARLLWIQPSAMGFYEPEKAMDWMALVPNVMALTR